MSKDKKQYYEELLLKMMAIHDFEEEIMRLYKEGAVHGTLHLCTGEEAVDVGSTAVLKDRDYIFSTHRSHGVYLGRGGDINAAMAEVLGRASGTTRGRGGSMHICDPEHGVLGSNGIVGANAPHACGAALTIKLKGIHDAAAVCFSGDGAANAGAVLESMNLAGVWKLPVIFVLVENHYAVSTVVERASANADFTKRAEPFGLECFEADGNDLTEVMDVMLKAREYAVTNMKPCLVVEHTYRVAGHSKSDRNKYRSTAEIEYWKARGPIRRFKDKLLEECISTAAELAELELKAKRIVKEATEYALKQPMAEQSADALERAAYAD